MPRGEKRKGGRPKGSKNKQPSKSRIGKEAAREVLREMVTARMAPMIEAQVANALGIKYLVVRAKAGGKFLRVTEAMARAKTGSAEEIIEVWEKDPSVQAFTDLMNRALDKPAEQDQTVNLNIVGLDQRIKAARTRASVG